MEVQEVQNTQEVSLGLMAELYDNPDNLEKFLDDPMMFEALEKSLTGEADNGSNRFFFDDFTIEISLKDIVD